MVLGSPALFAALFIARAEAAGIMSQQLVAEVAAIRDTYMGAALPMAHTQQLTSPVGRHTALMETGIITGDIIISALVNMDAAAADGHHGAIHAPSCASNGLEFCKKENEKRTWI